MVQLNIIAGSLGLFVLGVNAGLCRPTDATTTLAITETATATTDFTTVTESQTTAPIATTSTVPEGEPACNIESPQQGTSGGEFEVYCDRFAGGTTPIGSLTFPGSFSACLDHCDETPGCQGVNYVTTNLPFCNIWSSAGSFGDQKGVILAKRIVTTRPAPSDV
ncbi:unnamed protein product [Fusarium langsethiae]|nr:unnamed protein product [Fusarium langsethiae]